MPNDRWKANVHLLTKKSADKELYNCKSHGYLDLKA